MSGQGWLHRLGAACALLLVLAPGSLVAQPAELSDAQRKLIDDGVLAIIAGDLEQAIGLLQAANNLGEVNVSWLNLGRAYAKKGECKLALDAYERVATAPAVESPTPEEVALVLAKYREEVVPERCAAKLTVRCEPRAAKLSVDGFDPTPCPKEPLLLEPGKHVLRAEQGENSVEREIELGGMEEASVELTIVVAAAPETPLAPPPDSLSGLELAGIVVGSVGLAALATAPIIDLGVLGPGIEDYEAGRGGDRDELEMLQSINLALFVGGGALLATGVVLFLWPDAEAAQPTVAILPGGMALRLTF